MRLGLIGGGAIISGFLRVLALHESPQSITILLRDGVDSKNANAISTLARESASDVAIVRTLDEMIARKVEVVVEAAGHSALLQYAEAILLAGLRLVVASVGALSDDLLRGRLADAARVGHGQLIIPAGAVGAIDMAAALSLSGDALVVRYTGRKPPQAWAASIAATQFDLNAIRDSLVIFEGTARQAALSYPRNANVAATLALATSGFDSTQVRLIADPQVAENCHEFEITSPAATVKFEVRGRAAPGNAGTSLSTAYSILRATRNIKAGFVI